MNDIWQQEKNLTKAAKVLGELKSHLHTRESAAKTKVTTQFKDQTVTSEMRMKHAVGVYFHFFFFLSRLSVHFMYIAEIMLSVFNFSNVCWEKSSQILLFPIIIFNQIKVDYFFNAYFSVLFFQRHANLDRLPNVLPSWTICLSCCIMEQMTISGPPKMTSEILCWFYCELWFKRPLQWIVKIQWLEIWWPSC